MSRKKKMNEYDVSELLATWSDIRKGSFLSRRYLEFSAYVSKILVQLEDFVLLREFISGLTCEEFALLRGHELFLKAIVQLYVYEGNYKDAILTIKNGTFRESAELLDVWNQCHYRLKEDETGKQTTALVRFKIRKRFPPPPSICRHGVPTGFQQRPPQQLRKWFQCHGRQRCHPSTLELDHLSQATGLSRINVRKWLQKLRKKDSRKKCIAGMNSGSFTVRTQGCNNNQLCAKMSTKSGANQGHLLCNSPSNDSVQSLDLNDNMSGEDIKPNLSITSANANLMNKASKNCPEVSSADGMENVLDRHPVPQEKVTLHYFSPDVRNSWQPCRIRFLYDICRQEMLNKKDAASEKEHTDLHIGSKFDLPFPPNVSLIPFQRTEICNSSSFIVRTD